MAAHSPNRNRKPPPPEDIEAASERDRASGGGPAGIFEPNFGSKEDPRGKAITHGLSVARAELRGESAVDTMGTFRDYIHRRNNTLLDYEHVPLLADIGERLVQGDLRHVMVILPPRYFKALKDDTPIATPDGWSTMGTLAPGDYVFHPSGRPTRVVGVVNHPTRPLYRVRSESGHVVMADGDHLWRVWSDLHGDWLNERTRYLTGSQHNVPVRNSLSSTLYTEPPAVGDGTIHVEATQETGTVTCIQVDAEDGLFLAGRGLLVTHNSEIFSRLLTGYFLRQRPDLNSSIISYGAELAWDLSAEARAYYMADGGNLRLDTAAKKRWRTEEGGELWAAGVGGPLLGFGYNCFVGDTPVRTEAGDIVISELYSMRNPPRVLSFNHDTGETEYRRITARTVQPASARVRVRLRDGRSVTCTPEHRFFCPEHGYRQADSLVQGEKVVKVQEAGELHSMRQEEWQGKTVPGVCIHGAHAALQGGVRMVRRAIHSNHRATDEGSWSLREPVLWPAMFRGGILRSTQANTLLRFVRQSAREGSQILCNMFARVAFTEGTQRSNLRGLWRYILETPKQCANLLFSGVCGHSPLQAYARRGESSLQARRGIQHSVREDAPVDQGTRWAPLRMVRASGRLDGTPHRSWHGGRQPGEPSDAVQGLPHEEPHVGKAWSHGEVEGLERIREGSELVYDIQVEGNHNFFANGILVHNCGIIDDPTDPEKAISPAYQRRFREWFPNKFLSRREPGARIVIVMQRLGTDDPIDWLLRREVGEDTYKATMNWHVVFMDEIKSDEPIGRWSGPRGLPPTCTLEPDPREVGEVIAPTRFSEEEVKQKQSISGPYMTATQLQGRPREPKGEFWKKGWFIHEYEELPEDAYDGGWDWDTAYTKDEAKSATAGVRSYRGPGEDLDFNIYIDDINWFWKEFPQMVDEITNVAGPHYVEAKATGKSAAQALTRAGIPVQEVNVDGDKFARSAAVQPVVSNGRVYVHTDIYSKLLNGERQGLLRVTVERLQRASADLDLNDAFVQALHRHTGAYLKSKRVQGPRLGSITQRGTVGGDTGDSSANKATNDAGMPAGRVRIGFTDS